MQDPWCELRKEIAKKLNVDVSEIEEPDNFGDFDLAFHYLKN